MMTVAPVASASGAAAYYSSKDNYYFLGNLQSKWVGEGAQELGLEGPVQNDVFTQIMEGKLPDGTQLGKEVNGQHVHRAGHDLTFSAPKSVSLLVLIGGDKQLLDAHNRAVDVVSKQIEGLISARDTNDGTTSIVPTGKLVAAAYTHDTSRNLDPQLHTHLIVANVTELDGKWKALATDYIHKAGFIETVMANQVTLGQIYRNALREEVEKLGHETIITGKHGLWEIAGVPETVREEFSSRGKEIEAAVGADATLKSRDVAAKDTRQAKVDPSRLRLTERWDKQMKGLGFDMKAYQDSVTPRDPLTQPELPEPDAAEAVKKAISLLSDSKTRFTYGDIMLTALGASETLINSDAIRTAIDGAMKDSTIIPLDKEKGVFTSHIHLLDELSIQALAKDQLDTGKVVAFKAPTAEVSPVLLPANNAPIVIFNAPASLTRLRETAEQLVTMSLDKGRPVNVLASSVERAGSLAKSSDLKDLLIHRGNILDSRFGLKPNSTLIIEGAERLGLKETVVLLGEAREKEVQLVFLDSAGRQGNGNVMSVLESAGVARHALTQPVPGLEASVVSISDKRDRYQALADRYVELSGAGAPVTAITVGKREQQHLTATIRDAMQNAGKLGRDHVQMESRTPVYLDKKTRLQPETYRSGQVLEDRRDVKELKTYVIDRVHDDTRMLTLIDNDGVLHRQKIRELDADWRLFNKEAIGVAQGDQLIALAADKTTGIKAKDRLTVTAIDEGKVTARVGDSQRVIELHADRPLYAQYGYVATPGSRDNDAGTVLAAFNAKELNAQNVNALAQSGDSAEIFTAEPQNKAEERLSRMRQQASPISLVRKISGEQVVENALIRLNADVMGEAEKAVSFAVAQQNEVSFTPLELLKGAQKLFNNASAVQAEISKQLGEGNLLPIVVNGENRYVSRATWELEKSIIRAIESGKDTLSPLLEKADPTLLAGLTPGQRQSTEMVLGTRDQFVGIQGYAGVGKTTQLRALDASLQILPESLRPVIVGLAPTHQAVKEMRSVGIDAQTAKSFLVEHDQKVAAGENPDYQRTLFIIDESSMLGNQDTAEAYQAIQRGGGRGVSVGDKDQFLAVESGAPFKLVQDRSPLDVAIMKEIVRQNSSELKAAVYDVIENRVEGALERITRVDPAVVAREKDAVLPDSSVKEVEEPVGAIISDFISRTRDAREQTIIITQLNVDRKSINTGIHSMLQERGEIGADTVSLPVLDRVKHTRHELNEITAWKRGMVILQNDRYSDVVSVDKGGRLVALREEDGRLKMVSPFELNAKEVEVFTRETIEIGVGDQLRFNKTKRDDGHTANQQYRVSAVSKEGVLTLEGAAGKKVIDPQARQADQHIDYAWAVTGYGAQGVSKDYVIALEGIKGARKVMANQREFYINVSRAKEHVQIYSDGLEKWLSKVKAKETTLLTAHDALKPETERQQARVVWSMGTAVNKTTIGRIWLKQNDLKESRVTARIIPQTRKYPQPHLAFPVFDGNGKSAGVALVPLQADRQGTLNEGTLRLLATKEAQGAIVQRSKNGETKIVYSAQEARALARAEPQVGVVWQIGEQAPSRHLVKLTHGELSSEQDPTSKQARDIAARPNDENISIPPDERTRKEEQLKQQAEHAAKQENAARLKTHEDINAVKRGEGVVPPSTELEGKVLGNVLEKDQPSLSADVLANARDVFQKPPKTQDIGAREMATVKETLRAQQEIRQEQVRDVQVKEHVHERGEEQPGHRVQKTQKER
ncbi:conjugative transfer relaxase/helicase TraI [Serratia proteamaculans]|uniref:conjugative transfer relaxase/helicase TraI n=1 Tax=Serratia proteamaculans TaxID=28151 RepID=UPI0039BDF223